MGKIFKVQSVLLPYWGGSKISKGEGIRYKGEIRPGYVYSDILSGHHFFNLRGMMQLNATLQLKSWETFSKVSLILSFLEQLAVFTLYIFLTHFSP